MAETAYRKLLDRGTKAWNSWRAQHPKDVPDLGNQVLLGTRDLAGINLSGAYLNNVWAEGPHVSGKTRSGPVQRGGVTLNLADLRKAKIDGARFHSTPMRGVDLRGAQAIWTPPSFRRADLTKANLQEASLGAASFVEGSLNGANLSGAYLDGADFRGARLRQAVCVGARLSNANFTGADLSGADLSRADLQNAIFVDTVLERARIHDCLVYGVAAWNIRLVDSSQRGLVITKQGSPIVVDNLEIAQFLYLLLHNEKVRAVIDAITAKVVLLVGRFTPKRKAVLDAIREQLRALDYVPVMFDFDKPSTRDTQETITLLARMARFVIADITDARSVPQELGDIVPSLPSVPVQPILQEPGQPWGMYDRLRRYPWVLPIQRYKDLDEILPDLRRRLIAPAEAKIKEIRSQEPS